MKIVALHTDYRIYWPARWQQLANELERAKKGSLEVIEIFGKGSPYAFGTKNELKTLEWHVLFPDSGPEDMTGKQIKKDLFKLLDQINPDVVICGAIAFPSGALTVQWALKRKRKRVVCFDDTKKDAVVRSRIVNFVKRKVYDGVDVMFYPAKPWLETGEFWGFTDDEMVFGLDVVNNGFWSSPSTEQIIPSPYFLSVGRQIPLKNFLGATKAYIKYVESVGFENAIPLVLVGDGPEHEDIMKLIYEAGINEKIKCLPFQSQEKIRSLMQGASALILASIAETWGLVINEAMNCGCAIISTFECGATDVLVKDGINGYAVHCYDVDGMADAIVRFHKLSKLEKSSFAHASKSIISQWGLDKFALSAIQAAEYSLSHPKRKPNLIGKLIVNYWNGRYNPI